MTGVKLWLLQNAAPCKNKDIRQHKKSDAATLLLAVSPPKITESYTRMAQFSDTKNMHSWFLRALQDTYECMSDCKEDQQDFKNEYMKNMITLKDVCEEELNLAIHDKTLPIFTAILNSIDWSELYDDFSQYIKNSENINSSD
jgi:hypothetical protein